MLDRIIFFSIHNKLIVALFTVALILWGSYSFTKLPIDAVPDITNNQVQVITVSPSLAAQEVERLITFPVELTMATIPQQTEIRSISRFGLSVVTIVFTDDTDIYWARQQVFEKLQQAKTKIPTHIGDPELAPVSTGLGEIYQYTLHAKKGYEQRYSAMDLRTVQDWIVRRQLLGTKGVADVSSLGGYVKQYEIAIQADKLRSMNITITDIFAALEQNNENTGGAYIDKTPYAYFIRSEGLVKSLDEIGKIIVKNNKNGTPVLIKDVATLQWGYATRYGAMTRNFEGKQGEVVGALVLMLKGENSSEVIRNVKERVEQIRKSLPEGLEITAFLDRTTLVNNAIQTVATNLIEGALIVIFVLVLLLGNWRAGFIVASVIPLAMLFAISLMNFFGVSGNLMSLGAIDFGLIVDGAVIIVEAVLHQLNTHTSPSLSPPTPEGGVTEEGKTPPSGGWGASPPSGVGGLSGGLSGLLVYQAATKIRNSAAFGELIILIVYLPLLALTGVEGKMFKPMAQTVSFAILGAFILSLTYVPMLSALLLKPQMLHKKTFSDKLMDFFARIYTPILLFALRWKKTVIGFTLVFFSISLLVFRQLGGEFMPELDEGDFAVEVRLPQGSSLDETVRISLLAGEILRKNFPEVKEVVGKIGSGEIPTDPMPIEACDLMVVLHDKKTWTSAQTKTELAEKMSATLENIIGVEFGFQQPIQMRFNELMTGVRQDVAIKIFGEDLEILATEAQKVANLVGNVEGVKDLYVEKVRGLPQIVVQFDRDKLALHQVTVQEANHVLSTAFAGGVAGLVYEGEKSFELVVRLDSSQRKEIDQVRNLFVQNRKGEQVPLAQVATIEFQSSASQIQREDTKRRITVAFNVRGRDVESIVKEIEQKMDKKIKFPAGYYSTFGGQFQNLQEAKSRLAVAVPVALCLILVLLYFTFNSIKQSLLIFSAIPLSAIGGVFALWLRGMPFSISAGVGFIALFGVAVLNGIVLIGEFNYLKNSGLQGIKAIVLQGTQTRLRPVLLTAFVASLGFLPMALSSGAGGEVQKPLATVVIGGLLSATLLTLLVLPCLYVYVEWGDRKRKVATALPTLSIILLLFAPFITLGQNPMTNENLGATKNPTVATLPTTQPLNLQQLIALGLEQNTAVKMAKTQIKLQKSIKKTASDIGKTNFNFQYGQYNSFVNDNSLTVNQSFPFPTVISRQVELAKANLVLAELDKITTEKELVRAIRLAYFEYLFWEAKQKLLQQQDSLYKEFLRVATLRWQTGETNQMAKAMAELQWAERENYKAQTQTQRNVSLTKLQTLLHTTQPLVVETFATLPQLTLQNSLENNLQNNLQNNSQPIENQHFDSTALANNPLLASLKQEVQISNYAIAAEKAMLLPDITLGFFSQTLVGYQTSFDKKETYYNSQNRFNGLIAGLSFPLWIRPHKARIEVAKVQQELAKQNLEYAQYNLSGEYAQFWQHYQQSQQTLRYYAQTALPTAALLLTQAQQTFVNGEISYVEYFQALKSAVATQQAATEAVFLNNQVVIQLEFLRGE